MSNYLLSGTYLFRVIVKGVSLVYMSTQVVRNISPYTSYTEGRVWGRPTLYSGRLSQKQYFGWDAPLFSNMRAIFAYNLCKHVKEAYTFDDLFLSGGDAPLSVYASYE